MYKTRLILVLLFVLVYCPAQAEDIDFSKVGGMPVTPSKNNQPETLKTLNDVPVVENNFSEKMKSVKNLFDKPANAAPEKQELHSVAPPTAAQPPKPAPQKAPEPEDKASYTEGTSIMFDQTNIYRVMRVLSAYIESNSGKADEQNQQRNKKSLEELQRELLAKLKTVQTSKVEKVEIVTMRLPAFIKLDSIIFRSPTDKQAWINKHKFVEGDNNGEIAVKSIHKSYAIIALSIKDANINTVGLAEQLKKAGAGSKIVIDKDKQAIVFRLSVNQYLDLPNSKISEGEPDISAMNLNVESAKYYDPKTPEKRFVSPRGAAAPSTNNAPLLDANGNPVIPNIPIANPTPAFEAIDQNEPPQGALGRKQ